MGGGGPGRRRRRQQGVGVAPRGGGPLPGQPVAPDPVGLAPPVHLHRAAAHRRQLEVRQGRRRWGERAGSQGQRSGRRSEFKLNGLPLYSAFLTSGRSKHLTILPNTHCIPRVTVSNSFKPLTLAQLGPRKHFVHLITSEKP